MNQETFYGRWVHTMKTILLRETYDNNIKEIFRLRQLSTGQTVFTASKFGECDSNIKSLQKPIFAHIRVTSKCNLNCPYCYANDNTNKEDMSDQLLLELVDICNQNDILCITWTGGEPLIRKGFYSVVMKAYAHRIKQTILTNGTLLQKVAEQHWPQDNIDFQISLNEVWNNRESVKCSVENAEMLIKNGYAVVVTIMLEPVGIEEYKNLLDYLKEHNIKNVRFGLKIPVGSANQCEFSQYKKGIYLLVSSLNRLRDLYREDMKISYQFDKKLYDFTGLPCRFIMCEAGTTELYIDNNGDVYPCPLLKSYSFLYCGNVFDTEWNELWNSPAMQKLRDVQKCKDCSYTCGTWCRALKLALDDTLIGKSQFCLKEMI